MVKLLDKLREFRRPKQLDLEEYLKKLAERGLAPDGRLIPDPTPIAPPVGYKKQPSMVEIVRDMVRSEQLAAAARASGKETFEESEDFDVGDDPDLMRSPWENEFDPPLQTLLEAGKEAVSAKQQPRAAGGTEGEAGASPNKAPAPPASPEAPKPE